MTENNVNLSRQLTSFVRRHKIISVAVLVLVFAGLAAWRLEAAKSKGGYLTGKVIYGDIASTVSANATVQPTQEVILSFKNSGYVQNVYVTQGQFVKAGTVLAREQSSDYQAQLEQAEANLQSAQANYDKLPDQVNQAKAQLTQAQSNLNLAKTTLAQDEALFAAGAISKSTLEVAQNTCQNDLAQEQSAQSNLNMVSNTESAAAQVKSAQAGVTLAMNNLSGSEIVATMDGYVVDISGSTGQWTEGGAPSASSSSSTTSSAQFTITLSSNKLELLAEVNEADIAKVSTGDKVTFTVDAYADKTYTGTVTSLAAEATEVESVEYFESYVSIDDQTGLKAGMPATLDIISARKNHVLLVPRTALDYGTTVAKGESGSYVVVISNGKQRLTPVQTGLETDSEAEITSGLTNGEEVVLGSRLSTVNSTSSTTGSKAQSQQGALGAVLGGGPPSGGPPGGN